MDLIISVRPCSIAVRIFSQMSCISASSYLITLHYILHRIKITIKIHQLSEIIRSVISRYKYRPASRGAKLIGDRKDCSYTPAADMFPVVAELRYLAVKFEKRIV